MQVIKIINKESGYVREVQGVKFVNGVFLTPRYSENGNGWWAGNKLVEYEFDTLAEAVAEHEGKEVVEALEGEYAITSSSINIFKGALLKDITYQLIDPNKKVKEIAMKIFNMLE